MPSIMMEADQGNFSAGHVYTVNDAIAKRYLRSKMQVRSIDKNGNQRVAMVSVARIATPKEIAGVARRRATPPANTKVRFLVDQGKYAAGRVYSFTADDAAQLTTARKGVRAAAVLVKPDEDLAPEIPDPATRKRKGRQKRAVITESGKEGRRQ